MAEMKVGFYAHVQQYHNLKKEIAKTILEVLETGAYILQKNLGCFGDGGAVATHNADLATRIRKLRNHGSRKRSYYRLGFNSRLLRVGKYRDRPSTAGMKRYCGR